MLYLAFKPNYSWFSSRTFHTKGEGCEILLIRILWSHIPLRNTGNESVILFKRWRSENNSGALFEAVSTDNMVLFVPTTIEDAVDYCAIRWVILQHQDTKLIYVYTEVNIADFSIYIMWGDRTLDPSKQMWSRSKIQLW